MKIKAIIIEQGKNPRAVTITAETANYKKIIHCSQVEIKRLGNGMAALMDAEGRKKDLPVTCLLKEYPAVGTVILAGIDRDELTSIPYNLKQVRDMEGIVLDDIKLNDTAADVQKI